VLPGATIGRHCNIGDHAFVEGGARIGDRVTVKNAVLVWDGVTVEDDVFLGPNMIFTNDLTPRAHVRKARDRFLPTVVRRGASIGANATIVCGVTLGRYCFVGAGAVVTRDVPDYATVYGNPARVRGWTCYCGEQLTLGIDAGAAERGQCSACGRTYVRTGMQLSEIDANEEK
jgi:acetyltransferase-like isoleucine patch superfamily enzyme